MFKKLTKTILKEVDDGGDLKSLSSLYESKRLNVLSIMKIIKSTRLLFFRKERYHPTGVQLLELLQSKDAVDFGGSQEDITAVDISDEWQGNTGLKITGSLIQKADVNCQLHSTGSTKEISLESVFVSRSKLENRKLDEGHFLFKEMTQNGSVIGLGVVYEIMRNKSPLILAHAIKGEGSASVMVVSVASMDAGCKVDKKRQLKVDAGCALGFKVHPLHMKAAEQSIRGPAKASDGVAEFAEEFVCDFPNLKRRVKEELRDFREMDRSTKKLIWDPLYETVKYPQALYALDCMLEEGSCSSGTSLLLEVPEDIRLRVQSLLELVGLDGAEASEPNDLLKPMGFLVSALSELEVEAVTLILELDREVRGQVLKLVESVLELVYSSDGQVPQWDRVFSENAVGTASRIMTSCGLSLGKDGLDPSLGSQGAPGATLLALYIALKGLGMLLES
ncbi:hypothetical protein GJAV_G00151980 [Gymnothorax javanicus]|nr:hypothetical protein GJAV_G00151980 [Gymnothorax javanicus]